MKKLTLIILSAVAIFFCTAPASQAGPSVRFGVYIGGPAYYPGPYYSGPYYGYYGPHYYSHHRYYRGYHHWR